jgi:protein gp37
VPAIQNYLPGLAKQINAEHDAAVGSARDAIEHVIRAGNLLIEAKAKVKHGEWQDWVERNCRFSIDTAQVYMKVAKNRACSVFDSQPQSLRQALEMLSESVAESRRPAPEPEPDDEPEADASDVVKAELDAAFSKPTNGQPIEVEAEVVEPVLYSLEATPEPPKPSSNPTFNQTNDNVDWARWTWNPVTGCEHNCVYCYARDIANRFYPEKFTPTFRPERLSAPKNTRKPVAASMLTDPFDRTAWRNVFVCSMADLFGRWVPDEWIEKTFEACRENDQWNYLFLTKFPNRYVGLDFPAHSWIGTSVDEQKRVANAEKSFAKIKAEVKWLSVEPMREPLKFRDLSVFDWVVIGGQSASSQAPEFFPDPFWVNDLIHDAHDAGCKVYCKPNTDPKRGWMGLGFQEYPDAFGEE